MNKILTVSIAAYNVENYLDKTLASLNDKRFLDAIEVLIIDDGSTDKTADIALHYQDLAPNTFKYIAKENGGHGSTINKGIELATGKYFRVIDGDDWVDTDNFAKYIDKLKKTDTDIVLTQHKKVSEKKVKVLKFVKNMADGVPYTWSNNINIKLITLHMLSIKTELLQCNKIKITENCFYVDVEFVIWAIYLSESITYFEIPVYMYRVGNSEQSINKKIMLRNIDMQEKVSLKLVTLYEQFKSNGNLSKGKEDLIFRRVAISIGSTARTYLLMESIKEARENIIAYENKIKELSFSIFQKLVKDLKFFKILRVHNYLLLPVLRIMYRMWILKY